MSGKSQAIRLPKKFGFDDGCDEVLIRQVGRHLILSPRYDAKPFRRCNEILPHVNGVTHKVREYARQARK